MTINTRSTIKLTDVGYGHSPTPEEYAYLYRADPIVQFAIDTMVEDACRKGHNGKDASRVPVEKMARKMARLYGDSIVVLYDTNADLSAKFNGKALGCAVFTPLVGGTGYHDPNVDELDESGIPRFYRIAINGKEVKVDASRCVMYANKPTPNTYRGISCLDAVIDDIWVKRKWMNRFGYRSSKLPDTVIEVNRKSGTWVTADKTVIDDALGDVDHVFTEGEMTMNAVTPPFDAPAIAIIMEGADERIAAGLGVTKNDIKGAEAGQKLGTDANESTYVTTLEDIQEGFVEADKKVEAAFGQLEFDWNSPSDTPDKEKVETFVLLVGALSTILEKLPADTEVIQIARDQIVSRYSKGS